MTAISETLLNSGTTLEPRLLSEYGVEPVPNFSQLHYYARYFGDPVSRLFWHDEELWMGILPPRGNNFTELLKSKTISRLFVDRLFFPLEQKPTNIEGFESVWRLSKAPRITYWHEWSPKMWRAGALCLIELLAKLAEQGLTLRNPHPWNLLFDGRRFSYANPGSMVQFENETFVRSYEKIACFFVRPLLLLENGFEHIARTLISDVRIGVSVEDVAHLSCNWVQLDPNLQSQAAARTFLEGVAKGVEALQGNSGAHRWIEYFSTDCDFRPGTSWSRKQEVLMALLTDANIRSVIDLGANTGHYARLAASQGREVIATDFDLALVDMIFTKAQENSTSLYPAVLDFTHPTPGQGVNGSWFPSATERWKADLVLCFALAHHMVFGKYRLDFEQVASGIKSFARKWALVEYVPPRVATEEWRPDAEAWYSAENLATALHNHFSAVQILPPAKDGRQLLVCGPTRPAL